MSERQSFVAALREAEQTHQAERLRPGAVHRIGRRLDAELLEAELPRRRRSWIPMASFAAGAAMVLAVFTFGSDPQTAVQEQPEVAPMHASWQVGGDNCHTIHGDDEVTFDGRCRVEVPETALVIESRQTTRMHAVDGGVAMLEGTALFEVEPALEGPPRRVEVPGGIIEVLGTRFSVVVYGDHGHVDLLEGSIRFVADEGVVHEIKPGERFYFSARGPLAAASKIEGPDAPPVADDLDAAVEEEGELTEPAPPLAAGELLAALAEELDEEPSSRGPKKRQGPSNEELMEVVEQLAELRAQRKYQEAVTLLRAALGKRYGRRARQVLSYELGMILSTQLSDHEAACAHWAQHRGEFPQGSYERAIQRAEAKLGCYE